MGEFLFMQIAYAATGVSDASGAAKTNAEESQVSSTIAEPEAAEHKAGLSIQPTTVAFQALNFLILLVLLHKILYKPLIKLLTEREHKIKEGVENAIKAENNLKESAATKQNMLKSAKVESQSILEKARKEGEGVMDSIVTEAKLEAAKIVEAGHAVVAGEKSKALQDLQKNAVALIIHAAEKILREKIDPTKDAKIVEESLKNYSL